METARVASETSIHRYKRERKAQEPYDAGARKSSGSTGGGRDVRQGSDGGIDDFEDLLPKAKMKRVPNVWSIYLDDNHRLNGFCNISPQMELDLAQKIINPASIKIFKGASSCT